MKNEIMTNLQAGIQTVLAVSTIVALWQRIGVPRLIPLRRKRMDSSFKAGDIDVSVEENAQQSGCGEMEVSTDDQDAY